MDILEVTHEHGKGDPKIEGHLPCIVDSGDLGPGTSKVLPMWEAIWCPHTAGHRIPSSEIHHDLDW